MTRFGAELRAVETSIPGLLLWDLPVHGDNRGWFKENWQREKMVSAGLPDFAPVQNNISFNDAVGTTRGIHAEPWDKWVSVASGRIFGAWVDLREGESFGTVFTAEIDPSRAVFIPRGVGNAYQTLEPDTSYVYLVNDHWSPTASYTFLNLADETAAVPWPIDLSRAEISDKDRGHPRLAEVVPMPARKTLVLGAGGQLGSALRRRFGADPSFEFTTRAELDITSDDLPLQRHWRDYDVIINAAAYTAVDAAESPEGRAAAWETNSTSVARLSALCASQGITLVQISSDYVFDGQKPSPYVEDDAVAPLGVYGQTKAAGDAAAGIAPRHYVVRTSWVVGDGKNFVRTMIGLAERGIDPAVVADQYGRLTFADDIVRGIEHLIAVQAPFGVYNLTSSGDVGSWADIARSVFRLVGHDPERVGSTTAAAYAASAAAPTAPRPRNSMLDLAKIEATGFALPDWQTGLERYVASL
ncbi:sugar nucleotide-binding protein [Microbacterium sp. NPDC058389]|uniref:sugar nucleotide-binding protein n=1 Tax=Microbacterium sp. NPDC058389 TaxID=3346475 RepID=UPI0036667FE6